LVALGVDDDGMILWLNDRSTAATDYASQFLLSYDDSSASVDFKSVTSAGLLQVYTGLAAAQLIGIQDSSLSNPESLWNLLRGDIFKPAARTENRGINEI
jgi:hypothetical protein